MGLTRLEPTNSLSQSNKRKEVAADRFTTLHKLGPKEVNRLAPLVAQAQSVLSRQSSSSQ